jgi:hypothetical protein
MFRAGTEVLRRAAGISAERGGGMPGPARVVEKRAPQGDAIRMAAGDDRFRPVCVDDHADRLHRNAARLFGRFVTASNVSMTACSAEPIGRPAAASPASR